MSINLVKNGTFLTGAGYWRSDHIMGAEGLYEPGVGAPSPGCIKLPVDMLLWQKIETITKGKFELRFRAKGVEPIVSGDFVWLEVRFADDVFQAEYSATMPFGMEGRALGDWVDYSGVIELPDMNFVNVIFECIEADSSASLYIDAIKLEPLPEVLCDGLVHELQKRRRDFNAVKHPEIRYKEVATQAVNDSPSSLWETEYIDIEAELEQHWYQLESAVEKPEYVKRVLVHRTVGTDTEEEIIGRWTTEFGQDGYVYVHIDEAIYDGCVLRVEYAQHPNWPDCQYATTLPIDREWVLCRATTLLLMEADPAIEPPDFIERDLQYWDAKRVAREAVVVPRPRTAKARTLPSEAYQRKGAPCGDAADIIGGPTQIPVVPAPPAPPTADFYAEEESSSFVPFDVQFRDNSTGSVVGWAWSFGDGARSNAENPTHQYTEGGFYTVRLTVTDNNGQVNTLEKVDYINVGIPNADFMANQVSDYEPGAITFTNLSDGIITSYAWDFGDGKTSTVSDPSHLYLDPGLYTVTLLVKGPTGESIKVRPDYISILVRPPLPPIADFHAIDPVSNSAPYEAAFVDDSEYAVQWNWSFGDGETSTEQNPKHTYAAGVYTVSLTVTNVESVSDVEEKVDYIQIGVPMAAFVAAPVELKATETVTFTEYSDGIITSFSWTFGDGDTSALQHPTHVYASEGIYTVTLSVSGPAGSDMLTRTDYIWVDPPPAGPLDCSFYAVQAESYQVPYTVSFKDESQGDVDEWLWDFGDTGSSPLQHPTHQYTAAGIYTVKLTVTDTDDKTDFMERVGYVIIGKPIARFTASPLDGASPLDVTFSSTTSLGDIDTYDWDFGDEGVSALPNPTHQYTEVGYFTVKLTVDGDAGENTRTRERYIHVGPDPATAPICDFHAEPVTTSDAPGTIRFFDDSEGGITVWLWEFGDTGDSILENPEHQYATAGQYTVKLTVEDGYGRESAKEVVNYIKIGFPEASFTAGPREGTRPHEVTFVNNSKGVIDSYLWDFGDGNTSEEEEPVHIYTVAGLYTVALTAYGPSGSNTSRQADYITVNDPPIPEPVAAFSATPETSSDVPMDVQFVDESTGSIESWHWDFGDGHWTIQQNIKYPYQEAGIYTVRLTVTDVLDRTDYAEKEIKIGVPVSDFVASDTTPETGQPVYFETKHQGVATSFAWTFGDGGTSTERDPIYTYETADTYDVGLTVSGPAGSDPETKVAYITVSQAPAPLATADFRSDINQVSELPFDVQFTYEGQNAVEWAWTFGDGGSSVLENPVHTYTETGIYTVSLTVKNADSVEATETKSDAGFPDWSDTGWINAGFPNARFDTPTLRGPEPFYVAFRNKSVGTIDGYQWYFGDGYWSSAVKPGHTYETEGLYTVKLTADGPTGSHTRTRTDYILVDPPETPVEAAFRADPLSSPSVPVNVTFTDESTGDDLIEWHWTFGDGGTSVEQSPVHTYTAGGRFTVALTVVAADGRRSTATKEGHIVIGEVNAGFTGGPRTGVARVVGFENLTTGIVERYLWEFGDGETSDKFEPEYYYDTPGTFDVTLTAFGVVNDDSKKETGYIEVSAHPAVVADFDPPAGNMEQRGRCTIHFINKSTNAQTYLWDFDFLANPGEDTSEEKDPIWTFEYSGVEVTRDFTVKLVATGPGGVDDESKIYSLYDWEDASANFDATVTVGPKPLEVQFLNTSYYSNDFEWDFDWIGNPGLHTSIEKQPIHIYEDAGFYTVKLIAHPYGEGDDGEQIRTNYIEVKETAPPGRVTDGLMALYEFNEAGGATVTDTSDEGTALNLVIESQDQVTWGADGYLTVNDNVVIASTNPASKIISACKTSNEITLEAWVIRGATPEDALEHWIMGIMSTETAWWRNCAMGEMPEDDQLQSRMRIAGGSNIGEPQDSATGILKSTLIHLVVTRASDGTVKMYQDAVEIKDVAGGAAAFSNWDDTYRLVLANHHNGSRPWLGTLYLAAVYDRALTADEVSQNFMIKENGGPPPPPPPGEPDFYVSNGSRTDIPTGSDSGSGSETDPWLKLQFAVDQLEPGDTLGVLGTYQEMIKFTKNGTAANRITVLGLNDPAGVMACIDGNYQFPEGGTLRGDCPSGDKQFIYLPLVNFNVAGNYTTLDNLEVMRSRGRGINGDGRTGIHLLNCVVHDTRAGTIRFLDGGEHLVEDTEIYHSGNYCTVQRAAKLDAPWPHALLGHRQTNTIFRRCYSHDNYGEGAGISNGNGCKIVDCIMANNTNTGISMNAPVNCEIARNFVSFPDSMDPACGISVNGETGGTSGMDRDANGILVANNIVYGCSPGIRTQHRDPTYGIKNMSWYHNTIIHVRPPKLNPDKFPGGVSFKFAAPVNKTVDGELIQHKGIGYQSIDVRNNLCVGTDPDDDIARSQMAWIGNMGKPEWLEAITFSHNWWSHTPDIAKARSATDKINGPSVAETDLSPDRIPEDAQVLAGNKGINAGTNLTGKARPVDNDFWETERPTGPTMGAHEPAYD